VGVLLSTLITLVRTSYLQRPLRYTVLVILHVGHIFYRGMSLTKRSLLMMWRLRLILS